ncbi:MAG: Flp pilus assembly complex ATPase component TadA [Phycisphaeraceae bacterium]|nr:Flp pilus assembly complex ATPase component TadA [Phycisphaeraceae bacterium]
MNASLTLAVVMLSIYKPILLGIVVGLWAYAVGYLDKDRKYFYLPQQMWNGIFIGAGALAVLFWLLIPWFWLGFVLAVLMMAGSFAGYHFYRNKHVPPSAQWRMSLDSFRARWDEAQKKRLASKATVAVIGPDGKPANVPMGEDPLVPVHEALENLIDFALPRRAERIEMLADASQTVINVQIDGVKYPQTTLEPKIGMGLIDYLKQHAGMDVQDRRKKVSGKLAMLVSDMGKQKFELSTSGTTQGVALNLVVNPDLRRSIKFDDLGLLESQKQQLMPALEDNLRTVLVVCPPHQGMTTTLNSLTERHDPYTQNIMTLEQEIGLELEGVTHTVIKTGADTPSVSQQFKSLLLREPRVVLLSLLSDPDTAKLIPAYAEEMRFYVGLRQTDAFTALRAWIGAIGDTEQAVKGLGVIIAQRLLRKLCTTCRVPYQPDPEILRKLNLSADKVQQLYKHSGQVLVKEQLEPCPDCLGLGYRGRTGVFEVMVLDDEARNLIKAKQLEQARSYLRKQRMLYLQETALTKVVEGVTSISEITRVLAGDGKQKGK